MEFLYPGFLYALAALAIPILIHLFNFRRFKKIPFTNVRFLREIKQQTQSQNKLRHLLVLLMRLLALLFLVLAFAQPFIPTENSGDKKSRKAVSIFVDNSFSMEGEGEAGPMLEVAKNRAIDIAQAYAPTDKFQLLTQDFEGKHQRFVGQAEFIEWVQEIGPSAQSKNLNEITTRQNDQLKSADADLAAFGYIISDFQKSRYSFQDFQADSAVNISLVHLERNSPNNLYIDSVWFSSPLRKLGDNEQLSVRIQNSGKEDADGIPMKLQINGRQVAIGNVDVPKGSTTTTILSYVNERPGIQSAIVELEDYPVKYDDSYYFSYEVFQGVNVLSIRGNSALDVDFLKAAYAGDSSYQYTAADAGQISYGELDSYNLIVLNQLPDIASGLATALESFVKSGGSLWIIPSESPNFDDYNQLLQSLDAGAYLNLTEGAFKVKKINTEHPIYQGIFEKLPSNLDLPTASKYFKISSPLRTESDPLLGFGNGDPFLTSYRPGRGQLFVLAVPLGAESNNFSRHAIFVATALRIAELSRSSGIQSVTLDQNAFFTMPPISLGNETVLHLSNAETNTDVIPQYQERDGQYDVSPGPEVSLAGNYQLTLNSDTLFAVGINYKREESQLDSYSSSELETLVQNIGLSLFSGESPQLSREIAQKSSGTELWKICLFLVLFFLLLESVLLRFWKKQRQ